MSLEAVEALRDALAEQAYVADSQIATVVFLAQQLEKPILVEGPPGVGKTELAKAVAGLLEQPLVRLQCYEGLDEAKSLYEWQYGKQLLYTQILKGKLDEHLKASDTFDQALTQLENMSGSFYNEAFLEPRPLLQVLRAPKGAVLLVDEIDKSDEAFEAFLLELLSDHQVSIPELGTVKAIVPPVVFLTSNNTRELSDALKRRCLHLYIDYPTAELERQIVSKRVPHLDQGMVRQLVAFVQRLRELPLRKTPSVSETVDWARTVLLFHLDQLGPECVRQTLNVLLKHREDQRLVNEQLSQLMKAIDHA